MANNPYWRDVNLSVRKSGDLSNLADEGSRILKSVRIHPDSIPGMIPVALRETEVGHSKNSVVTDAKLTEDNRLLVECLCGEGFDVIPRKALMRGDHIPLCDDFCWLRDKYRSNNRRKIRTKGNAKPTSKHRNPADIVRVFRASSVEDTANSK